MLERYTALYSKLDRSYSQSISGPYHDLSSDGTVAALQAGQITGYWRPTVIVTDHLKEVKRLWDISKDIVYLDLLPVSPAARWLLSLGYKAEPTYIHVIDLQNHKWSDIRKSYHSLINADKDRCEITTDVMAYKEIHYRMAGRRTRSNQSWKIQQQQVNASEAYLVTMEDKGGVMVVHNEIWAYYTSGKCEGNSHALMWRAIEHAKSLGIKYFNMGEQIFFGDQKMTNISNFKRGFGGRTIMRLLCRRS